MPATYEPIATTSPSGVNSFSFTSIPSSYTDLRVVLVALGSSNYQGVQLQLNSDTAANYSYINLRGDGSAAASGRFSNTSYFGLDSTGVTTTMPNLYQINFFSYAGSINKTILSMTSEDYNGLGDVYNLVGLWRNTSAISTISFKLTGGSTFLSGTTATLYGIKSF